MFLMSSASYSLGFSSNSTSRTVNLLSIGTPLSRVSHSSVRSEMISFPMLRLRVRTRGSPFGFLFETFLEPLEELFDFAFRPMIKIILLRFVVYAYEHHHGVFLKKSIQDPRCAALTCAPFRRSEAYLSQSSRSGNNRRSFGRGHDQHLQGHQIRVGQTQFSPLSCEARRLDESQPVLWRQVPGMS